MRRKEREIKEFDQIVALLEKCKVLYVSMISEGKPYVVPVNFGYIVEEGSLGKKLSLYIHGAGEGKKVSALKANPAISFSCAADISTGSANGGTDPCSWTCWYQSVCGEGKAVFLEKGAEKTAGLDSIMAHYGYKIPAGVKFIAYNAMELAKTSVIKVEVTGIWGKQHKK